MNAQAETLPAERRPAVAVGGQVAALIPQNLDEAFRVANAFAKSGLAPQSLKSAEAILVSIMAGAELGFAPYQSMQSFAVINGRAAIWGDAIPALLWSRGFDLDEWFDDDDNPTKAFCKVTRPSGKVIERTFSLKDAKDAQLLGKTGPWQTARKRMLQMRARGFAARDGAADVLRGMPVYEEVQDFAPLRDISPTRPAGTGMAARIEARNAAAASEQQGFDASHVEAETTIDHDPDTGEIREETAEPSTTAEAPPSDQATAGGNAAEDERFPGDDAPPAEETKPAEPAGRKLTLRDRVKLAIEAAGAKKTLKELEVLRNSRDMQALRRLCEDQDPEGLLLDLDYALDQREGKLLAAEEGR